MNNSNWRANAIDNVGLIVEEIGYHVGYEAKDILLDITNYKVKIPREVVTVGPVLKNGVPLIIATDRDEVWKYRTGKDSYKLATSEDALELNKLTIQLNTLKELYITNPTDTLLEKIEDVQRKVLLLVEGVTFQNQLGRINNEWYEFKGGYLKTSFEFGTVTLKADVFMVDENGLPLVIDTFKYREACIWGMMYYIIIGGYVHPTLNLAYVEKQKDYFVGQAKNEPKIMTIERHQRFTEEWSSIARGINNETLNSL